MDTEITLLTGEKGMDTFDSNVIIYTCKFDNNPFEALSDKYQECRSELFDIKREYYRLKNNRLVKFLSKLGLIKLNYGK